MSLSEEIWWISKFIILIIFDMFLISFNWKWSTKVWNFKARSAFKFFYLLRYFLTIEMFISLIHSLCKMHIAVSVHSIHLTAILIFWESRTSSLQVFYRQVSLKKFVKFTRKHPPQRPIFQFYLLDRQLYWIRSPWHVLYRKYFQKSPSDYFWESTVMVFQVDYIALIASSLKGYQTPCLCT